MASCWRKSTLGENAGRHDLCSETWGYQVSDSAYFVRTNMEVLDIAGRY